MKNSLIYLLASASLVLVARAVNGAGTYSIAEVPIEANGISNDGTVIINAGATWTFAGGLQYLNPGIGTASTAAGISSNGTVAGSVLTSDGAPTRVGASIWQNAQISTLGSFQTGVSVEENALAVNASGIVVGYSHAPDSLNAVRWTNGVPEDIGVFLGTGASGSVARAINNMGQIVLTTNVEAQPLGASDDQSFVLNGTTITAITSNSVSLLGVHATAISASGTVAGTAVLADSTNVAFIWSNGQMTLSPSLFQGVPGAEFGNAISDQGLLVGSFSPEDNGRATAFLWDGVNNPVDLNTMIPAGSGWYLYSATGVNADGDIVGNGLLNGVPTGFLLNPVASPSAAAPEPATTATLLLAIPLLLRRRRNV